MRYKINKNKILEEMEGAVAGGGVTSTGAITTSSLGSSSNPASTSNEAISKYGGSLKTLKNKNDL